MTPPCQFTHRRSHLSPRYKLTNSEANQKSPCQNYPFLKIIQTKSSAQLFLKFSNFFLQSLNFTLQIVILISKSCFVRLLPAFIIFLSLLWLGYTQSLLKSLKYLCGCQLLILFINLGKSIRKHFYCLLDRFSCHVAVVLLHCFFRIHFII